MSNSTPHPLTRRVFFAVAPDRAARQALSDGARSLLDTDHPRLRWLDPGGWHVTLRFVGAAPEPDLEGLRRSIHAAAAMHAPATLQLDRITLFPDARRPRVLAATGPSTPSWQALVAELETACQALGFAAEQRPWRCHLSLARIRGRRGMSLPSTAIDVTWRPQALLLMESVATGRGPRYVAIESAPLGRTPLE